MPENIALTYVEIDIRICSLTYGTAPCTAAIPGTGTKKCFNTLRSCQDRDNFDETSATLRFGTASLDLPKDIECFPVLLSVEYDGVEISLGENLGVRANVVASFKEFLWSDTGTGHDKYLADRSYDPVRQGSFWSRFRARHPFLRGVPMRVYRGFVGQTLAEMEEHNFVIEDFSGPGPDGVFSIRGKDVLKIADDDRAVAPAVSNGYLSANVSAVAGSATLVPAGIGNLEYPASGKAAIGGKEIVSFTRSGDVLTITRAQLNTTAVAHLQDDRVQLVLEFSGDDPAGIIYDLLVTYAGIPAGYIDLDNWLTETETYFARVFTAYICEPTGVNELISEVILQAALAVWWDDETQEIRLQVLRAIPSNATVIDMNETQAGTFNITEQPEKRVSQVWTYYAQRNPLEPVDREDNYRSIHTNVHPENEFEYGSAAIKTIKSRWIPFGGRTTAETLNLKHIARFCDPPRLFDLQVMRTHEGIDLGSGYYVGHRCITDDEGVEVTIPAQVTWKKSGPALIAAKLEEIVFADVSDLATSGGGSDPTDHTIVIDSNAFNINLRTLHDTLFPEITDPTGITVTCIINSGVIVGSTSHTLSAFDVGSWVAALDIVIINNGKIRGAGGPGGGAANPNGSSGGIALYTRYAIDFENNGDIKSGGGGGAASKVYSAYFTRGAGGGGAGVIPGAGGDSQHPTTGYGDGANGTQDAGGARGSQFYSPGAFHGGAGGAPGVAGSAASAPSGGGSNGSPGAAGAAVDGVSYVNFTVAGTRAGSEIN